MVEIYIKEGRRGSRFL